MGLFDEEEAMFNRYSEEKQEEVFLDVFRKIENKGFLYWTAIVTYAKEEQERNTGKRGGRIIQFPKRDQAEGQ